LHYAAYNENSDTVKLLLEAGANIEAQNKYG
jgi:ankyrin repeat protein